MVRGHLNIQGSGQAMQSASPSLLRWASRIQYLRLQIYEDEARSYRDTNQGEIYDR